jgi:hypothetical protein
MIAAKMQVVVLAVFIFGDKNQISQGIPEGHIAASATGALHSTLTNTRFETMHATLLVVAGLQQHEWRSSEVG